MAYIENPKTRGSGIVCAIPQAGACPVGCADCFFQSGRSYLEPLAEHLPNLPEDVRPDQVVRVNDGNDSNHEREAVIAATDRYPLRFFNTSQPRLDFPAPVVLTLNPGNMTDANYWKLREVPDNLMFVRFRANTWNRELLWEAVERYTVDGPGRNVPVVVTFMAYYTQDVPADHREHYEWRKRTLNSYWCITPAAREIVMGPFRGNPWVYTCGGPIYTECRYCGNCLREYHGTMERLA